ncbi:MAG: alcohol dehydrogenase catalytic domain-containing protein, partial [Methylococcales bacterium]|nr:alcohol dehydrogenase catalytic domain-containing protein [Methylococcales bacterium]
MAKLLAFYALHMMKAIVFYEHGGLDKVSLANVAVPSVAPDEVLVQVKAAALNRLDLWVLAGWPALKLNMPHVMGSDGAGIITQLGANVTNYQIGDRVAINPTIGCGTCHFCLTGRDNMCDRFGLLGEHYPGFYGEYRNVPAKNLLKLPKHVPFAHAAAASLVYVTAWHSLIKRGGLQAGEDVLIVGA